VTGRDRDAGLVTPSGALVVAFNVRGTAAPQGSKRLLGHGALVESSARVKPWRSDVRTAAEDAMRATGACTASGPVAVHIFFAFTRPKSHPKTRVTWPTGRSLGDIDKLCRAILDAITSAGVIADDSQVIRLVAGKRWTTVLDGGPLTHVAVVRRDERG